LCELLGLKAYSPAARSRIGVRPYVESPTLVTFKNIVGGAVEFPESDLLRRMLLLVSKGNRV
jgi:hypothetical protein